MVHLLLQVTHEVQYDLLFRILVLFLLLNAALHHRFQFILQLCDLRSVLDILLAFDFHQQLEKASIIRIILLVALLDHIVKFPPQVIHQLLSTMVHLLLQVTHEVQYSLLFRSHKIFIFRASLMDHPGEVISNVTNYGGLS